jgi:hypothetical protein
MGKKTLMFLNTDENIKIFILFDTSNDIVVLNFDVWRVKCACMPWGVVALCRNSQNGTMRSKIYKISANGANY